MALHTTSGRWQLGFLLAISSTLLWGTLPIALSIMLRTVDAYTLTWYRMLGSGLVLALILAYRKSLPTFTHFVPQTLFMLLAASAGLSINYVCYVLGLEFISPSAAQIVIQVAPILLLLGGLVLFKESFSKGQTTGLLIFITGLLLFFHSDLDEVLAGQGGKRVGILFVVAASIGWTSYALLQKQLLNTFTSPQIMLFIYLIISVALIPVSKPGIIQNLGGLEWGLLLFCVFNSLVAYGSFAEALEHWDASRVGAVLAMSPILTIGFVFIGAKTLPNWVTAENLDALSITGACLVVVGSLVTALWGRKT